MRGWDSHNIPGNRRSKGLTLIEIMIVVAILGILSAVAIPSYNGYQEKRRIAEAREDIVAMSLAIEQYITINREMPANLDDIGWRNVKDPWDKNYLYRDLTIDANVSRARADSSGQSLNSDFDLWSRGPNKKSSRIVTNNNGSDDILRAFNGREVRLGKEF